MIKQLLGWGQAPPLRNLPSAQARVCAGDSEWPPPAWVCPSGLQPREGTGPPKVTQPRGTEAVAWFPISAHPSRWALLGGPRAYLAHPAASGSIAPAEAGAGTGRPREAPPEPQRIPVPPRRATAPRNLRPASLEFGSAPEGAGEAARS